MQYCVELKKVNISDYQRYYSGRVSTWERGVHIMYNTVFCNRTLVLVDQHSGVTLPKWVGFRCIIEISAHK